MVYYWLSQHQYLDIIHYTANNNRGWYVPRSSNQPIVTEAKTTGGMICKITKAYNP